MTTLVDEYAADIQLDWFWVSAPSSKVRSEDSKFLSSQGVDLVRSVAAGLPVCVANQSDLAPEMLLFTYYYQILDHVRPREWASTASRI